MTTQIELFTVAIEHKEKALDAMRRFALPEAKAELQVAQEIDPSLADVKTLLQATEFSGLSRLGNRLKSPEVLSLRLLCWVLIGF